MHRRVTRAWCHSVLAVGSAILLAASPGVHVAGAQQPVTAKDGMVTVVGQVVDASTGAPVVAASVSLSGTATGTLVDSLGRFRLGGIAPGRVSLRARALGYAPVEREIVAVAGRVTEITIALVPSALVLQPVQTQAVLAQREQFEGRPDVGRLAVSARELQGIPRFAERDVLRAIQLLPGVQARNDYTTGFNVRGGESDQNLILIDGYPIYNPFHLGGLFGTFIDPAVGGLELLTGAFAAGYGGRLSSVLDVQSSRETRSGVHGTADVSLIASTASMGGSTAAGQGSWLVAGRRTYADKVMDLVKKYEFPYHFQDAHAHIVQPLPGGATLAITGYIGSDVLDEADAAPDEGFRFSWGNRVLGTTVSRTFGGAWLGADSVAVRQRASVSHFATNLDIDQGTIMFENRVGEDRLAGEASLHLARHRHTAGYELSRHRVRYAARMPDDAPRTDEMRQRAAAVSAFYDDLWRPTDAVVIQAGLRFEAVPGAGWSAVSPRVSAKYFLTRDLALSVGTGHYTQWMHSLVREDVPLRLFEFWVASDTALPVSRAWHYVAGAERWLGARRSLKVEGFYKDYRELVESNPHNDPAVRGDEFLRVGGASYGVDVLLRQFEGGPFSGWLAYSYTFGRRVTAEGERFFPAQDRRHEANVVGMRRAGKYELSVRYGFAGGTPYTDVIGEMERREYDPIHGTWRPYATVEVLRGPRNGRRLPSTQRLDLSVTRHGRLFGTPVSPFLSVVNAANRKNVFTYVFDYSESPPTRKALSQFPLLPTFGVSVAF